MELEPTVWYAWFTPLSSGVPIQPPDLTAANLVL
jgi:hypothetical protein